jgi:hypothetical protein
MRLRVIILPLAAVLAAAVAAVRAPALPVPQQANVTSACTPGTQAQVTPATIAMKRTDNVVWGSVSPNATSWTIAPKDTLDWLWSQRTFTGTPKTPATTPEPLASAKVNHPYRYKVTVACEDGTTQVIDPDIIIGGGQ